MQKYYYNFAYVMPLLYTYMYLKCMHESFKLNKYMNTNPHYICTKRG